MKKKKSPRATGSKPGFSSQGAARGGRNQPGGTHRRTADEREITPNRRKGFAGGERPYDYSLYESEKATPEYMNRLFNEYQFPVTKEQLSRFWKYYDLLRQHNAKLDLTRIMGIEATVLKHFIDSAIILRWFDPSGPVLDIGSGPGFPGIPMAIMRLDISFILAESRGKRVGFLEKAIAVLGLKNVETFPRSVREDSPLGDENGKPVGDVITRALESISPTLDRIRPFIRHGARAVFMKGPLCDQEIDAAKEDFAGVFTLEGDIKYNLPNTEQGRRLVLFRKINHA